MERKREIALAVADLRTIERRDGVNRESLERIKQRVSRPARPALFPASDLPPLVPGGNGRKANPW